MPGPLFPQVLQSVPGSGNRTDRYPPADRVIHTPSAIGLPPGTNRTAAPMRRNILSRDSALHTSLRPLRRLAANRDRRMPGDPPVSRTRLLFAPRAWFLSFAPTAPRLSHPL